MQNQLLTIFFILISYNSFSQLQGTVVDLATKEKLPYINIWVENEDIGTTSNEHGEFVLPRVDSHKTIVFTAIGYETKKIKVSSLTNIVELTPVVTSLQEVIVYSKKATTEVTVGAFNKLKINYYFAGNAVPWIVARFFPFKAGYEQTPFLKKIRILTKSDVNEARFNIRFYSVDENGEPEDYIYAQNIYGLAKKRKKIVEIDVSEYNIRFPERGMFIAFEWLIIEQNKYEYIYYKTGSKKKYKGISYEPSIGAVAVETDQNSWIFLRGKWQKIWRNSDIDSKRYGDKFSIAAIELTLSN
jgi:carboxypeptidase-like protein